MATEVGKPGTNWKQVTPEHRRKIAAIVNHYRKMAHPFTACVRDNRKRFGANTEKVCAVVKDMGERTTKWRKGGGKRLTEAAGDPDAITAAAFDEVIAPALDEAGVSVEDLAGWVDDADAAGILTLERLEPEDLTPEQLEPAAAAAGDRLALLESRHLPAIGSGALYDQRLVEAAGAGVRAQRALKRRGGQPANADFESKHKRGRGGKWIATGSSGREVRAVQRRVGARVDGDFGANTAARVRAFQKKHGLVVDGVVGRQTVAALRGRKDAKRVKVGQLTEGDRTFLRGHVKGHGGRARTRVVEAAYDPKLHPKDRLGRWKEKVGALRVGESAHIGGRVSVKRTGPTNYEIHGPVRVGDLATSAQHRAQLERDGTPVSRLGPGVPTADRAAILSAQKSAQSDAPDSLGGSTKHPSLNAYLASGGKSDASGGGERELDATEVPKGVEVFYGGKWWKVLDSEEAGSVNQDLHLRDESGEEMGLIHRGKMRVRGGTGRSSGRH